MNKQTYIFIFTTLLTFQNLHALHLRSIIDEAKTKLNALHSLVFGSIQAAEGEFSHLYTDLDGYSHNTLNLGNMDIDNVYESVQTEMDQFKELAHTADVDISICLKGREELIVTLRDELKSRLEICLSNIMKEAGGVLKNSKYVVDVTMNKVHSLEHELNSCGNNILCISPILTKIELDVVALPQHIKTEVNNAGDLLKDLGVNVANCRNNNVADFTSYVSSLVAMIADCVNKIIPKI